MFKITLLLLLFSSQYSDEFTKKKESDYIFPSWKKMYLLNKQPIESDDHRAYVDIYLNEIAKEYYILEKSKFPVGSIVIKPLYPQKKRENLSRLMIMMKMEDGYDSNNGNWWYGIYDKTGTESYEHGRIISCIRCHEVAEDTDYMFSESVMHEIVSQPILKIQNTLRNKPK